MLRGGLLASDVAAAAVAALVPPLTTDLTVASAIAITLGMTVSWPALAYAFGLYAADELSAWASGIRQAARLLVAALVASWPLAGTMLLLRVPDAPSVALATCAVLALASATLRATARTLVHRADPLRQRALIVGSGTVAGQLVKRLRAPGELGVVPVGLVDDEVSELDTSGLPRLGRIEELGDVIPRHDIDRVIISFSRASHSDLLRCIRTCRDAGVAVDVVPRLFEFLDGAHPVETMRGLPLLSLDAPQLSGAARAA